MKVLGADPAKPAISFAHFGFDLFLMSSIRRSEYSQPTPIQAQVKSLLDLLMFSSLQTSIYIGV